LSTLPRILFLTVPYAGGAVGKEKTMEILHERVAGLDVHKNTVVACVRVITGGQTARECRTFSTTTDGLEALRVWLSECRCTHVAMEATGVYWTPILRILGDGEFELIVVNAAHFKNVPGRKTDMNDAMWLADLLAFGLVKASFVPTEQMHELRSLTRTRKQLVREQTRHVQRIQKTLTEANIRLDSVISDIMGASGRRIIEAMIAGVRQPRKLADLAGKQIKATPKELYDALHGRLTDHHRFLLELHLRQWDGLDTAIRTIDLEIDQRITSIDERRRASDPPFRALIENLDTTPGVSAVAAPAILSEIGHDMSRFPTAGHLLAWAGMCPGQNESAGKRKPSRLRKGAPWLKTMLVQCAWAAIRKKGSYYQAQFHRLRHRRGPQKAICAVAASILTAIYHMLKNGTEHHDLGVEHFNRRSTDVQAKRLVARLAKLGFTVQLKPATAAT
jgi:transposase